MGKSSTASRLSVRRRHTPPALVSASRFDRRLAEILAHAAEVFCKKGYEGASMRDLSRASGMSLAGLYYYFESKERLLFLVQKHTFTTILQRLMTRLEGVNDPEERIRVFILSHREYYRVCVGLLDQLDRDRRLRSSTRIADLSLFGMMNSIYTWHNARIDADA